MVHATQTLTRTLPTATLLLAMLAAAPASAAFEVVLADGRRVEASTRPVMALGRVNFHDASGQAISLSATVVDLPATRKALRRETGEALRTTWTADDLATVEARLEFLGPSEAPDQAEEQGRSARAAEQVEGSTRATHGDQVELLRGRLEKLEAERRSVRADDPRADILSQRHYLLQTELLRLTHAPEPPLVLASR